MVTKKSAGRKGVGKPKLKMETIQDLDVKGKSANVKGGTGYFVTGTAGNPNPVGPRPMVRPPATTISNVLCH